jgi:hypothetical protein
LVSDDFSSIEEGTFDNKSLCMLSVCVVSSLKNNTPNAIVGVVEDERIVVNESNRARVFDRIFTDSISVLVSTKSGRCAETRTVETASRFDKTEEII